MHGHVAFVVSTRRDFLRHMFEVVRLFTVIYLQGKVSFFLQKYMLGGVYVCIDYCFSSRFSCTD